VAGLSPVPCWGKKQARLTIGLPRFWQSPQDGTVWGATHHPLKMYLEVQATAGMHCSTHLPGEGQAHSRSAHQQIPPADSSGEEYGCIGLTPQVIGLGAHLTFQSRHSLDRSEQTRVEKGLSAAPNACSSKPTTQLRWVAKTKLQACDQITAVQTVYCPLDASPCQHQYPNFSCYKQRLSEYNYSSKVISIMLLITAIALWIIS